MSLIKDLREAKGLSRKELAERVGVSVRAVKSWELKERMPRRAYCDRLCRILDTDKGILDDIAEGAK